MPSPEPRGHPPTSATIRYAAWHSIDFFGPHRPASHRGLIFRNAPDRTSPARGCRDFEWAFQGSPIQWSGARLHQGTQAVLRHLLREVCAAGGREIRTRRAAPRSKSRCISLITHVALCSALFNRVVPLIPVQFNRLLVAHAVRLHELPRDRPGWICLYAVFITLLKLAPAR